MMTLSTLAFVWIVITAMTNLVFRDWRINAAALALQFLAAFILTTLSWPLGMSLIKLIVGWMATAALTLTCLRQGCATPQEEPTASHFFRGLAGLMVILVIFLLAPALQTRMFPRIDLVIIQGGLMLIGMSLMLLGTNSEAFLNVISLLSLLSGFEVIHAALELSTLLTGLFAIVNLGLALVGVYLIVNASEDGDSPEEEPE